MSQTHHPDYTLPSRLCLCSRGASCFGSCRTWTTPLQTHTNFQIDGVHWSEAVLCSLTRQWMVNRAIHLHTGCSWQGCKGRGKQITSRQLLIPWNKNLLPKPWWKRSNVILSRLGIWLAVLVNCAALGASPSVAAISRMDIHRSCGWLRLERWIF